MECSVSKAAAVTARPSRRRRSAGHRDTENGQSYGNTVGVFLADALGLGLTLLEGVLVLEFRSHRAGACFGVDGSRSSSSSISRRPGEVDACRAKDVSDNPFGWRKVVDERCDNKMQDGIYGRTHRL